MYPSSIFLAEKYNEDGSLDDQMLFGNDFKAMIKRVRSDIKNGIPLIETNINSKKIILMNLIAGKYIINSFL